MNSSGGTVPLTSSGGTLTLPGPVFEDYDYYKQKKKEFLRKASQPEPLTSLRESLNQIPIHRESKEDINNDKLSDQAHSISLEDLHEPSVRPIRSFSLVMPLLPKVPVLPKVPAPIATKAPSKWNLDPDPEPEVNGNANGNQEIQIDPNTLFVRNSKLKYFFKINTYKARLRISLETFFAECNNRVKIASDSLQKHSWLSIPLPTDTGSASANEGTLKGYCHVVGLGLGVWQINSHQAQYLGIFPLILISILIHFNNFILNLI